METSDRSEMVTDLFLFISQKSFKDNGVISADFNHPLSFVIDEIKPVSRWREFGYPSPRAAAEDWNNLQAAHYCCNAAKSNKTEASRQTMKKINVIDGDWWRLCDSDEEWGGKSPS